jgi:hypothetical protein
MEVVVGSRNRVALTIWSRGSASGGLLPEGSSIGGERKLIHVECGKAKELEAPKFSAATATLFARYPRQIGCPATSARSWSRSRHPERRRATHVGPLEQTPINRYHIRRPRSNLCIRPG